jgi:hypothetical protein
VDVGVTLVGANRENVHPLSPYLLAHRLGDPVNDPLQIEVLLDREVARNLLFRRDQRVPVLRRIHGQEDDSTFVDDVMIRERRARTRIAQTKQPPGRAGSVRTIFNSARI